MAALPPAFPNSALLHTAAPPAPPAQTHPCAATAQPHPCSPKMGLLACAHMSWEKWSARLPQQHCLEEQLRESPMAGPALPPHPLLELLCQPCAVSAMLYAREQGSQHTSWAGAG